MAGTKTREGPCRRGDQHVGQGWSLRRPRLLSGIGIPLGNNGGHGGPVERDELLIKDASLLSFRGSRRREKLFVEIKNVAMPATFRDAVSPSENAQASIALAIRNEVVRDGARSG